MARSWNSTLICDEDVNPLPPVTRNLCILFTGVEVVVVVVDVVVVVVVVVVDVVVVEVEQVDDDNGVTFVPSTP